MAVPVQRRLFLAGALRYSMLVAFVALTTFFTLAAPTFLTAGNLISVLVNNFTLLAIIAIGMTLAVSAGGIDLSVGTAVDLASLAFVSSLAAGYGTYPALLGGLACGLATGLLNTLLIAGLGITPFLATLGTLFIGRSAQQLLTGGGNPVYIPGSLMPATAAFIGHGTVLGVPASLWIVAVLLVVFTILLGGTAYGRQVVAIGAQPAVAWHSGLAVRRDVALVYALSALVCSVAGIVLSSTVNAYVPSSGNAFLLNAIGATFIGTTLSTKGRPNLPGTALGVLLINIVGNGLLLIGWNFYWQQVGTGGLILLILAVSFSARRLQAED